MPSVWEDRERGRRQTQAGWLDAAPAGRDAGDWNERGGFNPERFQYDTMAQLGRERRHGVEAEQGAWNDYRAFDPRAAFEAYNEGALGETRNILAEELEALADQSAGTGRLRTGFYDRDRGDVARRVFDTHLDRTRQAALATAGMRQQQLAGALNYGQQARNRYLEFLAGAYDRMQGEENAGGGLFGALGGIAGGIGGFMLGGPAGAAAGSRIGGSVGNSF